jgi:hypothetical protein
MDINHMLFRGDRGWVGWFEGGNATHTTQAYIHTCIQVREGGWPSPHHGPMSCDAALILDGGGMPGSDIGSGARVCVCMWCGWISRRFAPGQSAFSGGAKTTVCIILHVGEMGMPQGSIAFPIHPSSIRNLGPPRAGPGECNRSAGWRCVS